MSSEINKKKSTVRTIQFVQMRADSAQKRKTRMMLRPYCSEQFLIEQQSKNRCSKVNAKHAVVHLTGT